MLLFWIHPHSVSDPDLLSLADLNLGMGLHKMKLNLKFLAFPQIIRIQE